MSRIARTALSVAGVGMTNGTPLSHCKSVSSDLHGLQPTSAKDLEAIVKTGQLSYPEAEQYLLNTLIKRRDLIGKAFVEPLTPLDPFTINQRELCAIDLSVRHELVTPDMVEVPDARDDVKWDRRSVRFGGRAD